MPTTPLAVVDPQLRVRGVDGLRVIDASVMPTVTSANTNAAALMIGERGARLVLGAGWIAAAPRSRLRRCRVGIAVLLRCRSTST